MVAITHGNDYNAHIWTDTMDTDNSLIYIHSFCKYEISSYDDSMCYIDIIEICWNGKKWQI